MDLQLLKTFLAVLEAGSYSRAGGRLGYAQSTVTKHIQLLEDAYHGAKLFSRQGNRMVPTAAGKVLEGYARQMLQLYDRSQRELLPVPQKLSIGASYAAADLYQSWAIRWLKAHWASEGLQVANGNPEQLWGLLKEGHLNLILLLGDPAHQLEGFQVEALCPEPLAVVLPERHPLAGREQIAFDDIREEPLVLTKEGCSFRQFLLEAFSRRGVPPRIVLELDGIPAIKQAVRQRYGVGFLPLALIRPADQLVPVPFGDGRPSVQSLLAYPAGQAPLQSLFREMAAAFRKEFRPRP